MVKSEIAKNKEYIEHFKGKESWIFTNSKNQSYISKYLKNVKKRSENAYRGQKSVLYHFFEFVYEKLEDKFIMEITKGDIKEYFNEILDEKRIQLSTKECYRSYLWSFFDFVEDNCESEDKNFLNPVPKKRNVFSLNSRDIKKQSEKDKKLLSKEQLFEILDYCKKKFTKRIFSLFGLCICTGARISEILSIKIDHINLKERYFETGFEINARKSTLHTEESLIFFFPERFKTYLKNYIIPLKNRGIIWLFPTYNDENKHIIKIQYFYEKIRIALGFHFSMHYFRHSMITYLKKNKCPLEHREMLLNHVPSSVQAKYYEHEEIEERRKIYDRYFPYYDFSYF